MAAHLGTDAARLVMHGAGKLWPLMAAPLIIIGATR
jgi:hypothetical protein